VFALGTNRLDCRRAVLVDALVKILTELLADMDKIEQLGKAGRERVLKDFNISANAEKLRKLIKS